MMSALNASGGSSNKNTTGLWDRCLKLSQMCLLHLNRKSLRIFRTRTRRERVLIPGLFPAPPDLTVPELQGRGGGGWRRVRVRTADLYQEQANIKPGQYRTNEQGSGQTATTSQAHHQTVKGQRQEAERKQDVSKPEAHISYRVLIQFWFKGTDVGQNP